MDPRKDFIHIDDVFKQLHNGEEPERSGSWLQMKDLLDKEMPLGAPVAGGRSFRRYFIPLLALLLIGGGAAYYGLSNPGADKLASGSHSPVPGRPGKNDGSMLPTAGGRSSNEPGTGHIAGAAPAGMSSEETGRGTATAPAAVSPAREAGHKRNAIAVNTVKPGTPAGSSRHNSNNHKPAVAAGTQQTFAAGPAAGTSSGKTIVPQKENGGRNQAIAKVIEEEQVIEEIRSRQQNGRGNTGNNHALSSGPSAGDAAQQEGRYSGSNLQRLAMSLNNKKIVKDQSGNLYKEERDTFKRVDLIERMVAANNSNNGRPGFKTVTDTVAVTRVEKIRYVPLDPMEMAAFRKMYVAADTRRIVPLANVRDRVLAKEMVSLVPLTHYKVASRKVDPGKFNQLVQNTSRGISNYFDGSRNFYAAILVGGNTSFANPGAFGMQLGIAGLYSLGERLTLAAEFKYVNHYFSNYSLNDQSVTFENITSQQQGAQWLFSGTQTTATSAYKVNSFSALELPVTLSYNLGRVSIFGGVDMAYAFPISWKKETSVSSVAVQQAQKANQNPFLNEAFRLDEQKDFASRIGLGYVWGISYDFSRKMSLDARMSQILVDNNKGNTDALSRLFRMPTLQLSLGYYFGRKDKVVYIMDKR